MRRRAKAVSAEVDSPIECRPGNEGQSGLKGLTIEGSQPGKVIINNAKTILEYDDRPSVGRATNDHEERRDPEGLKVTIQKLEAEVLQLRGQMSRIVEAAREIEDPATFRKWIHDQG